MAERSIETTGTLILVMVKIGFQVLLAGTFSNGHTLALLLMKMLCLMMDP